MLIRQFGVRFVRRLDVCTFLFVTGILATMIAIPINLATQPIESIANDCLLRQGLFTVLMTVGFFINFAIDGAQVNGRYYAHRASLEAHLFAVETCLASISPSTKQEQAMLTKEQIAESDFLLSLDKSLHICKVMFQ